MKKLFFLVIFSIFFPFFSFASTIIFHQTFSPTNNLNTPELIITPNSIEFRRLYGSFQTDLILPNSPVIIQFQDPITINFFIFELFYTYSKDGSLITSSSFGGSLPYLKTFNQIIIQRNLNYPNHKFFHYFLALNNQNLTPILTWMHPSFVQSIPFQHNQLCLDIFRFHFSPPISPIIFSASIIHNIPPTNPIFTLHTPTPAITTNIEYGDFLIHYTPIVPVDGRVWNYTGIILRDINTGAKIYRRIPFVRDTSKLLWFNGVPAGKWIIDSVFIHNGVMFESNFGETILNVAKRGREPANYGFVVVRPPPDVLPLFPDMPIIDIPALQPRPDGIIEGLLWELQRLFHFLFVPRVETINNTNNILRDIRNRVPFNYFLHTSQFFTGIDVVQRVEPVRYEINLSPVFAGADVKVPVLMMPFLDNEISIAGNTITIAGLFKHFFTFGIIIVLILLIIHTLRTLFN